MADRKYILNILNYDMTDIFTAMGLNTQGGTFEFVDPEEIDAGKKMEIVEKLHNMGLPISHDYLYDTFGIEKPDNYNELIKAQELAPSPVERAGGEVMKPAPPHGKEAKFKNWLTGFFGDARRDRALEW